MSLHRYFVPPGLRARARLTSPTLRALSIAFAALVAGSRAIPLGDNGALLRDLAARTGTADAAARPTRWGASGNRPVRAS